MSYYAVVRADGVRVSKLYSRKGDAKRQLPGILKWAGYEGSYVQAFALVPVAES